MRTRRTDLKRCSRTGLATAASLPGGALPAPPFRSIAAGASDGIEDGRLATESIK